MNLNEIRQNLLFMLCLGLLSAVNGMALLANMIKGNDTYTLFMLLGLLLCGLGMYYRYRVILHQLKQLELQFAS